jgi:hypothetical protein
MKIFAALDVGDKATHVWELHGVIAGASRPKDDV